MWVVQFCGFFSGNILLSMLLLDSNLNIIAAYLTTAVTTVGVKCLVGGVLGLGCLNFFFENSSGMNLPNTLLNGLFGIHPMCMLLVYVICLAHIINCTCR